ncbi:MAG: PEP-CTERM sorting domain-containing protein [Acidobacteria bacterium]|nr:PEP-CTERM sorting domain-containing protein [Acidobacteriota bacterium]
MTRKQLLTCLGLLALFLSPAQAAYLSFTSPVSVNSTDIGPGVVFLTTAMAYAPTDRINISTVGTVCLQPGDTFCTNGAGVVVIAGSSPVGGSLLNGSTSFGSLLMGNATLGFFQIFPTDASNGLGSGAPPTTVTRDVDLATLGFAAGIGSGEALEFRISDTFSGDNSGSFRVSDLSKQVGAVPEPGSVTLVAAGIAGLLFLRRRRA